MVSQSIMLFLSIRWHIATTITMPDIITSLNRFQPSTITTGYTNWPPCKMVVPVFHNLNFGEKLSMSWSTLKFHSTQNSMTNKKVAPRLGLEPRTF